MGIIVNFIVSLLYVAPAVLIALSLHEFAHGLVSYSLGDPTPKANGRLSLNPFRHMDLWGTLLLLFFGFGWAKPVSVDPRYYENPKTDMVKVALAGPLMNFVVAFVALFFMVLIEKFNLPVNMVTNYIYTLLYQTAVIDIGLGLFNLIPIPPLDGSKVLFSLLPERYYFSYMRFEQFGMIFLLVLISVGALDGFLVTARSGVLGGMVQIVNRLLGMA